MNTVLTAIAPYIVSIVAIIIGYFSHRVISYIPAQQRAYIAPFAQVIVAMIEQKYAGFSDEQKKALALSALKSLFKDLHLPAPSDDVLEAFIEAAVNALPGKTTTPAVSQ